MERIRSIRIALYADIAWTVGDWLWDANVEDKLRKLSRAWTFT